MYYNILQKKMSCLKLFVMAFFFSIVFSVTTVYAAVPYTYTTSATTISGVTTNKINVTFDYVITDKYKEKITLYQTSGSTVMRAAEINDITINDKILTITIKQLDPDVVNYAIKIPKDALIFTNYTTLTDFILPFSSTDFASGFKSIFLDNAQATVDYLNKYILAYNSLRDINIYAPKKYITSIETIHKKYGLTTNAYTKLTNIDVKTDVTVKRLKVSVTTNTGAQLVGKELFPSSSFAGFTTGQAGLDIDTGLDYSIRIEAFDVNGKLLEDSSYKKKLIDVKSEIVTDYITAKTSTVTNKAITLYDLMKTPATLISMLQSVDPNNLDSIKVMSLNTKDTRIVSNSEGQSNDAANVLAKALGDIDVQFIKFASALSITPTQTIKWAKPLMGGNVVLDGNGSTINGDVTIGNGLLDNNIYDLRNITINGTLTIDVSNVGDCILNKVKATITIVKNKKASRVVDVVSMEDKTLYKIGDFVKIGVKFNEPIFVTGNPILKLNIGNAEYDKTSTDLVSTKDIVVFTYKVVDRSLEGESILTNGVIIPSTIVLNSIFTNGGIIQDSDGANLNSVISFADNKQIYTLTTKNNIEVDPIIPFIKTLSVISGTTPQVISCEANDLLEEISAENKDNWIISSTDSSGVVKKYNIQDVNLNGDKRTVTIVMEDTIPLSDINSIRVVMATGIKDKAGNSGDSKSHIAPLVVGFNAVTAPTSFRLVSETSITVKFTQLLDATKFVAASANGFKVSNAGLLTNTVLGVDGLTVILNGTGFTSSTIVSYTAPGTNADIIDLDGNKIANIVDTAVHTNGVSSSIDHTKLGKADIYTITLATTDIGIDGETFIYNAPPVDATQWSTATELKTLIDANNTLNTKYSTIATDPTTLTLTQMANNFTPVVPIVTDATVVTTPGVNQIETVTVTTPAKASGNLVVTFTVGGVNIPKTIAVISGDSTAVVAGKIQAAFDGQISGWTVSNQVGTNTILFTTDTAAADQTVTITTLAY